MNIKGNRVLLQVIFLSVVTFLLYLLSMYLPILDIVIFLGAYLPIAYICSRYKLIYGIASIGIIYLLLFFTLDGIYALSFLFTNAIIGLTIGCLNKRKQSGMFIVATLIIVLLISIGIYVKITASLTGINILSQTIDYSVESVKTSMQTLKTMGFENSAILNQIKMDDLKNYLEMAMPGMALISVSICSWIYYIISQKSLKKVGINMEPLRPFSKWYLASSIANPVLILLLMTMFIKSEDLMYISFTIRVIFVIVFTVNALATISYYLKLKKFPNPLIGIILFIGVVFLQNILPFIGMFEHVFNLRGLDDKRFSIRRK